MSKDREVKQHQPPFRAVITGSGSFAPKKILTNDQLTKIVDTTDEWITSRTGIKTRHITDDNETTAFLAAEAAKIALADARVKPENIEVVIVTTITPEMVFPSTACFVQADLGAVNAFAFDLAATCSGFIYGLSIAQQFIENGRYKNALVIGAETLTKITNWKDRSSCILFGDGAGAALLERSGDKNRGVLYSTLYSDGTYWETLNCQAYGSRYPSPKKLDDPNKVYMEIKGREVYQLAVRRIVEVVHECLEKCHLTTDDVALIISHQMNARIIESVAKRLELPDEKMFVNINEYGNTSAASIPIAFDQCLRQGKLKKGDLVIFAAFGGGLTWGANVIRL
jgi:3-oxoacyl-[acyl-carrier-protein] synthase III